MTVIERPIAELAEAETATRPSVVPPKGKRGTMDGGAEKIPHVAMIDSIASIAGAVLKSQRLRETCITRADMLIPHLSHSMSR